MKLKIAKLRFVLLACASMATGWVQLSIAAIAQNETSHSDRPIASTPTVAANFISLPPFETAEPNTAEHNTEILDLEALAQSLEQSSEPVEITNIQVEPVGNGLDVVLETPDGVLDLPIESADGNRLVINVPGAVLSLPDGQPFQATDPTEGITAISVTQTDSDSVQVIVEGVNAAPTSNIRSEGDRLVLGLSVVDVATTPESPDQIETTEPKTASETAPTSDADIDVDPSNAIRIIVTAEKTPEEAIEVPLSLTVLTEEEITDGQIDSIADISANVPNFYFTPGDRVFNIYSIRGIGNSSNILIRDSVSYYIDDVPYDNVRQFFPSDLFDLEQVEVLRGPQSTLYGRNSQAGVVNITSRPPGEDPGFRYGLRFAGYGERQVQFSASQSIVPDTLGLRLAGSYRTSDGYTDNILLDNNADEQESLSGRANLVWTPSDDWNVAFNANASRTRDDASVYVPIDQDNPFETSRSDNGAFNLDANTQSLRVGYEGDSLRFTSITSRSDTDYEYIDVNDEFGSVSLSDYDQQIFNQEFRLQSPEDADRFQWIAGAFFQNRDFRIGDDLEFTDFGTDIGESEYDQTTYAGFAQIDYKPIEPLTLTAGLRYEYWQEELNRDAQIFEDIDGNITESTFFPVTEIDGSDINGDVLLPKIALSYEINPNLVAYGSITRGYRPGTHNYLAFTDEELIVDAENSWNYEIGVKTSWLDDRLGINLSAFYNDINNAQVIVFDDSLTFADISTAQARAIGAELEMRATPVEGFDIIAGFGYTDAEYTDNTNPFTGESFDGNKLLYSPDYTYNLAMQYRSPGGLFGRFELQGTGTVFFDEANETKESPFAIANARVGYEFDNAGVYLFSNNLFDTEYVTLAFPDGFGGTLAGYGDRRTFGVEVRGEF